MSKGFITTVGGAILGHAYATAYHPEPYYRWLEEKIGSKRRYEADETHDQPSFPDRVPKKFRAMEWTAAHAARREIDREIPWYEFRDNARGTISVGRDYATFYAGITPYVGGYYDAAGAWPDFYDYLPAMGITAPTTQIRPVEVNYADALFEGVNVSNFPIHVEIYTVKPRYLTSNDPAADFGAGLSASYLNVSWASSGAGGIMTATEHAVEITPFDVPQFTTRWKVIGLKKHIVQPGRTLHWKLTSPMRNRIVSSEKLALQRYNRDTRFCMIRVFGTIGYGADGVIANQQAAFMPGEFAFRAVYRAKIRVLRGSSQANALLWNSSLLSNQPLQASTNTATVEPQVDKPVTYLSAANAVAPP